MLVRFVKKSMLVKRINALDINALQEGSDVTHRSICQTLINELQSNLYGLPNTFFQQENCHFYLVYLHLSYLFLNGQLTYKGVESDLAGFLAHMRSTPREEILNLNQDDFLQAYQCWMITTEYKRKYLAITPSSDTSAALPKYLEKLLESYPHLTEKSIKEKLNTLSGINSLFFKLDIRSDGLMKALIKPASDEKIKTPIISVATQPNQISDSVIIPPVALTKWIAKQSQLNPEIEMEPIFGTINTDTLYELHCSFKHPVGLTSPFVAKNLTTVHDIQGCTSVSIALHDELFHFMALSLYPVRAFLFTLHVLIPETKKLQSQILINEKLRHTLKKIENYFNDFTTASSTNNGLTAYTPTNRVVMFTYHGIFRRKKSQPNYFFAFLLLASALLEQKDMIQERFDISVEEYVNNVLTMSGQLNPSINLSTYVPLLITVGPEFAYHVFSSLSLLAKHGILDQETVDLLSNAHQHAEYIYTSLTIIENRYPSLLKEKPILYKILQSDHADKLLDLLNTLMQNNVQLTLPFITAIIQHIEHLFTPSDIIGIHMHFQHFLSPSISEYIVTHIHQADRILFALSTKSHVEEYISMFDSPTALSLIALYPNIDGDDLRALLTYGKNNQFDYQPILAAVKILFDLSPALVKPNVLNRILALSNEKILEIGLLCTELATHKKTEPVLFPSNNTALINRLIRSIYTKETLEPKILQKLHTSTAAEILGRYPDLMKEIGYTVITPSTEQHKGIKP